MSLLDTFCLERGKGLLLMSAKRLETTLAKPEQGNNVMRNQ